MNTFVRCGSLFTGREDEARPDSILVFDGEGRIVYAGVEAGAPRRAKSDRLIDHSGHFVMPGLIDVHTHLAYGNAKSERTSTSTARWNSVRCAVCSSRRR